LTQTELRQAVFILILLGLFLPIWTDGIELWGLRQQLQYCHPTKMPIQDTPKNGERAMLCIEFQVSQRCRHHIHQRCPKRKKHQTSRPLSGTSQRTSAATPGKAKQPNAKTTLTDRNEMK